MNPHRNEKRRSKRVAAKVPVRVKTQDGMHECTTRDLSTAGIFFYCGKQLSPGSPIELVLVLPEEITGEKKRWVCCQGKVSRIENGATQDLHGVAAEIDQLQYLPEIE